MEKKEYIAEGIVYGKTWGGGFGAYPASRITAKSKAEILSKAGQDLKSGALDSGMGFEFLKGARLDIKEVTRIIVKGKEYQRADYITEFIGNLTEQEQDFLLEVEF
jgi:hypothetical protein